MTTTHKTAIAGRQQLGQPDCSQAPLPPQWAFVVQLRQGTSLTPTQMHGRIEHICSGHAATFSSFEEARVFIERVLAATGAEKPP